MHALHGYTARALDQMHSWQGHGDYLELQCGMRCWSCHCVFWNEILARVYRRSVPSVGGVYLHGLSRPRLLLEAVTESPTLQVTNSSKRCVPARKQ